MSQQQSQFHEDGPSEHPYGSQYYQPPMPREVNRDPREQPGYYYDPHTQAEKLQPAARPRQSSSRKWWVAIVIGLILFMGMMSSHFAANGHEPISAPHFGPHFGPYHMDGKPGGPPPAKMMEYQGTVLDLRTIDANIHVHTGNSGNVQINSGGNAPLSGGSDGTTITLEQTGSGQDLFGNGNKDIDITMPASMSMNIETTSGSVEVAGVTGKVNITAVNGDIQLDQVTLANGSSVQTTSGDIHFNGALENHGTYDFNTVSGSVQLHLPASTPAKVTTDTMSGDVHKGDSGAVNSASPDVTVNTVSGDINVEYDGKSPR
ncbi:hypothetical protein KDW_59420 [Dictyobacter vulcani]|uniref:DUF4097 domain-containing protein n=1 Tax=Dictyobacter vulcani TaxID=2607529 RepID=A0A5J4KZ19_9CHLR|nr:DUF4097 family beta strand repeat-containing protein [Dictyobacter vulcani]GER91780.1 hypothetical protein KDW_59420 [Dictyobacter vulcani]